MGVLYKNDTGSRKNTSLTLTECGVGFLQQGLLENKLGQMQLHQTGTRGEKLHWHGRPAFVTAV
eukprot:1155430-Pelagomonas_calceolata.AAC.5